MTSNDGINFRVIGLLSATGMLLLVITVIGAQAFYLFFAHRDFEGKWGNGPLKEVAAIKESQKASVERLAWVDRKNEVAAIPVEQAFEVLEKSGGKVPASRPSN